MIGTLLVATICLAKPDTFKCQGPEKDISVAIDMPVRQCETQAQGLLPQVMQAFPNNVVTRYKCVVDNGKRKLDI
jgi:hypothetical protein